MKSLPEREICTPMVTAALFTIGKTWKQPKCPTIDVGTQDVVRVHTECDSATKNEILPFATTWVNPENIMLSEINQTQKDKYYMISLTRGI